MGYSTYQDKKEYIKEITSKLARTLTREELAKAYDDKIERIQKNDSLYYKYNYSDIIFFTKQEQERKERNLKEFDRGNPAIWHTDYSHFGYGTWGEDVTIDFYTDGTYKVYSYSCD